MADASTPRSKRLPFPFHPPLFAAFPVLSIYSANLAIIPLSDLWRPLGVVVLASFPIWAICALVARNLSRGASAASVVCATLILYSPIGDTVPMLRSTIVWGLAIAAMAIAMARLVKNPYWLNLIGSLLVLVSFGGILSGEIRANMDLKRAVQATVTSSGHAGQSSPGGNPDIFYIILDGYGRQDALKRVMNFDNSNFVDGLKKRGFYVAERSHSNYVQTEISLSSSLNVDLIPKLLPKMARTASDRSVFDGLISDNNLSRFLRGRGYRTIAVTSGFPALRFPLSDVWLTEASSSSLFETTLLQMSPFVNTDRTTESQFLWRRGALMGALKNVESISEPSTRPRFVFVHILAPHPPFVFGPHGEVLGHHGPFGYWDGSDFMHYMGTPADYQKGYVGQVQYLNGKVLETLDTLIKNNPKAIILVQGDHGSKKGLDQNEITKTDLTECFENLSCYYVPDEVRKKLYPTITPVNSFRIILSTLFGADLPKLPDRSWYSPFGQPFMFTDVSDRIEVKP